MKKMIIAFVIGLFCANMVVAQDCDRHSRHRSSVQFKVIKPKSVVKSASGYLGQTGKKMWQASKDFWKAPFTTVGPALETKEFKYTFPKIEWRKGLFQHIPAPPSDEDMKDYLIPIIIEDGPGQNPTQISEF